MALTLMETVIYIGPQKEKDLSGYLLPFGVPTTIPADLARDVLRYANLYTQDPDKVPDQRPSRIKLLRAEIAEMQLFQESFRDELAIARTVTKARDKDLAAQVIEGCQSQIDWAQSRIDANRAELALLQDEADHAEAKPAKAKKQAPRLNTGDPGAKVGDGEPKDDDPPKDSAGKGEPVTA